MSCERLCLHTAHLHAPQVTHINNNQKQHQRASPKWVDSVSFRFEIGVGIEFLGAPNRLVGKWPQGLACPWLGKHRCVRGCPRKQVCMLFSRVGWDYPGARSLSWTPQEGLVFLSPCQMAAEAPPGVPGTWWLFFWEEQGGAVLVILFCLGIKRPHSCTTVTEYCSVCTVTVTIRSGWQRRPHFIEESGSGTTCNLPKRSEGSGVSRPPEVGRRL